MHRIGKAFPKSDRSPAIVPVAEEELLTPLGQIEGWQVRRTKRISSGFYKSHAVELVRIG
jgi:magnesium-protoporphyrin O-methyltransferase